MIPYSTCMRFNNIRRHSLQNDKFSPSEWTLVQHFGLNARVESAIINVTSQDDQTLCFTWAIESQNTQQGIGDNPLLSKERSQSDELDRRSVYLLLALRRRKSLQQSIHPETIPLLDPYYYGISQRYLKYSYKWNFNTFSFDVLTSGHSLSSLLLYFFNEYRFIEIFNLDLINVLRCFHFLEKGYHDTNPYHNSVHAADVTQAMHCFLQETKIKQHLTPLEAMCALLAAVSHDLDHPGVNQQFLIATNSHLTTMHNNLSVLESHHWRFALSCFYESHIFDHFDEKQWKEIKFLLKHLILATDISRQGDYIQQFHNYLKLGNEFTLDKKEHKYFILQIALKCADLGNPCRPWKISQRWSEQICSEFYRQGDFEKLLGLPVTPMCDRCSTTISKTQTDFFKNVVRPLFELWNTYLDSALTRQLINNLNFNEYMWKNMETKCSKIKHCRSLINLTTVTTTKTDRFITKTARSSISDSIRCKSFNELYSMDSSKCSLEDFKRKLPISKSLQSEKIIKKCINGCGTPSSSPSKEDNTTSSEEKSSKLDDADFDEDDDFISDINCGAILSTPALILPNFCFDKPQSGFYRRGSAPGCIDIRRNDLSAAKGAALLLLCNSLKANNSNNVKRRSSFPNVKIPKGNLHYNASLQSNINRFNKNTNYPILDINNHHKTSKHNKSCKNGAGRNLSNRNRSKLYEYYHHQYTSCRSSLFDISQQQQSTTAANHAASLHQYFLNKRCNPQRRGSVPQDIFIRSLNNYTA